ncbi:formate dehydrogenase family accessory protein FdhD [Virgibacillus phasianinus]|uniref:Sulfur carrier protein FdhD n=2 Tax=Virgibacillus phasianinus TaxID=2017483 RepID=A0A220U8H9_9BACI|nr:formate dehydrogenase family accessory protein FdhD [Virgibacillus phasianinus]
MTVVDDTVAREFALTVSINGEQYATIVCTPTSLKELVIGFLASEGIIGNQADIQSLTIDDYKGFAYVELNFKIEVSERTERWIGSCCGKSREFYLKQDVKVAKTIMSKTKINPNQIVNLMQEFDNKANVFSQTGGVHQAGLATSANIETTFIDIGRHNALDKLFGYILLNKLPARDFCILFSGRISSEVVLKVSKIGAGILLAKSAPTDLALKLADDLQITAVGFIRNNSLNVYTHGYRILNNGIEKNTQVRGGDL